MLKNQFAIGILIVIAIAVIVLLYSGIAQTAVKSGGIQARLTGHGTIGGALNADLTIAAILKENGEIEGSGDVHGVSLVPPDFKGRVVELVPPSGNQDYWCVNLKLFNVSEELSALNWIWFVKDSPDGDMISSANGEGLTCATAGTPGHYDAVTKGGYNGFIK